MTLKLVETRAKGQEGEGVKDIARSAWGIDIIPNLAVLVGRLGMTKRKERQRWMKGTRRREI